MSTANTQWLTAAFAPAALWYQYKVVPFLLITDTVWAVLLATASLLIVKWATGECARNDGIAPEVAHDYSMAATVGGSVLVVWPGELPMYSVALPAIALFGTLIWRVRNLPLENGNDDAPEK